MDGNVIFVCFAQSVPWQRRLGIGIYYASFGCGSLNNQVQIVGDYLAKFQLLGVQMHIQAAFAVRLGDLWVANSVDFGFGQTLLLDFGVGINQLGEAAIYFAE